MTALYQGKLYLIRHGQTEDNHAGRISGQNDSPLTELGIAQAQANGRLLREIEPALDRFAIYSSPLHRARRTLDLAWSAAGLADPIIKADRRLMELDVGDWTGLTREEIIRIHPDHFARVRDEPWSTPRPRGESQAMLHARVLEFLQSLAGDAVIVCHGGTARMIRGLYLRLSSRDIMAHEFPNAGLLRLADGRETPFGR